MTIDGYQVLKENNYTMTQVWGRRGGVEGGRRRAQGQRGVFCGPGLSAAWPVACDSAWHLQACCMSADV